MKKEVCFVRRTISCTACLLAAPAPTDRLSAAHLNSVVSRPLHILILLNLVRWPHASARPMRPARIAVAHDRMLRQALVAAVTSGDIAAAKARRRRPCRYLLA